MEKEKRSQIFECTEYFRARPAFSRGLKLVKEKWRSYGRSAGTVKLADPSEKEREAWGGFLGKHFHGETLSFTLPQLERALKESRFSEVALEDLLEAYFRETLISRQAEREKKEEEKERKRLRIREKYLREFGAGSLPFRWMESLPETVLDSLLAEGMELDQVCRALSFLEQQSDGDFVRLAVLGMECAGNPHAFDRGTKAGNLLCRGLMFRASAMSEKAPLKLSCLTDSVKERAEGGTLSPERTAEGFPSPERPAEDFLSPERPAEDFLSSERTAEGFLSPERTVEHFLSAKRAGEEHPSLEMEDGIPQLNAERIWELYDANGILADEISSFTVLYGIRLFAGDEERTAAKACYEQKEPFLASLANLSCVTAARPESSKVFVVENQMVFSELCQRCPSASLICTSGQMKTASLKVLDLLCRENCEIFYSSDMDPEGLGMADRLLTRSRGRIRLWHMAPEDYEVSVSGVEISPARLKKLDHLGSTELAEAAELLRRRKLAGYQEALLDAMERDMKEECI